jgi:hypothetical protein
VSFVSNINGCHVVTVSELSSFKVSVNCRQFGVEFRFWKNLISQRSSGRFCR